MNLKSLLREDFKFSLEVEMGGHSSDWLVPVQSLLRFSPFALIALPEFLHHLRPGLPGQANSPHAHLCICANQCHRHQNPSRTQVKSATWFPSPSSSDCRAQTVDFSLLWRCFGYERASSWKSSPWVSDNRPLQILCHTTCGSLVLTFCIQPVSNFSASLVLKGLLSF